MQSIAEPCLDSANEFVVFDFNRLDLLLPHVAAAVPVIIIDKENWHAIPEGVMPVKVRLFSCRKAGRIQRYILQNAMPQQQHILVQAFHLKGFLA